MKKYILTIALSFFAFAAFSQKLYFIYLQSENEQPFYARFNEKVMSSTASGYLILPRLKDSTYNFAIGFPQNKWPEQQFTVTVGKKDHGYLVRNFAEKGWGLFDLQSLELIMALTGKTSSASTENNNVSGFTATLSKAADDPSLKEKQVTPVAEEKKPEATVEKVAVTETPVKQNETVPATTQPAAIETPVKKEDPAPAPEPVKPLQLKEETKTVITPAVVQKKTDITTIEKEPAVTETKLEEQKSVQQDEYKISTVVRRSESSTTEGFGLVYLDKYDNGSVDTVRLIIPNPKQWIQPAVKEEAKEEKKMLDIPVEVVKVQEKPTEEKAPETVKEAPITATTAIKESKPAAKTNCPDVAAEADFFKLRKMMAAAENEEDMTSAAKKYFRDKCFTTAQIKNLSTLYLADQGKYQFLDVAYTYAADPENYSTLQAELKDEYYVNRFRAMLRN